jgi:hypothetical protein
VDPEVEAMGGLTVALDGLEPEQQARVLRWAAERYGISLGVKKPTLSGTGGIGGHEGEPSEYADLGDLFSAAAPSTDEDRALVVASWLQEFQEEKQPNVTGAQVNKELKNLGHGSNSINKVFDALIATSPQQVIQVRKSGTTRQGRKNYKVTRAGVNRVRELLNAPA